MPSPVAAREARRILIVAIPPVRTLDVYGPAEVFGEANRLRKGETPYRIEIVSAGEDKVVRSHLNTPLLTDRTYRDCRGTADTLLVAGGLGACEKRYTPHFLEWLRKQSQKARRFGSVCTGALVLAEAGLLDGRRATTHWNWCGELARNYPKVKVERDPIFVRDGTCSTSAGVTAGIDLSLALVEEDLGSATALQAAQMMVVFLRRPGGQSQFSATLAAQTGADRPLSDLLAWISDNIADDLSIPALARRAAMSPRNFARLFLREVGTTPGRHIEDLRLEAAQRQLASTMASLDEIAAACGFGSSEILRRAFVRRIGVTPGRYRASFGRSRA